MDLLIKGEIIHISEVQTFGAKGYQKRNVLVQETEGDYPNTYSVEFGGKNLEKADSLKVGAFGVFKCNFNSRQYNDKTTGEPKAIGSLQCWKVENEEQASTPKRTDEAEGLPFDNNTIPSSLPQDDGLPF